LNNTCAHSLGNVVMRNANLSRGWEATFPLSIFPQQPSYAIKIFITIYLNLC